MSCLDLRGALQGCHIQYHVSHHGEADTPGHDANSWASIVCPEAVLVNNAASVEEGFIANSHADKNLRRALVNLTLKDHLVLHPVS